MHSFPSYGKGSLIDPVLEMMGTQSNGNPYCGRSATVYVDDKSVVVKLVDKCMGCVSFLVPGH